MMRKILIVAKDSLLAKSLELVCKSMKLIPIVSGHEESLSAFLSEEPSIILVCDYEEGNEEKSFKDIKNSSTKEIVLRAGFGKYGYEDYLQLPFNLKEFKKKIKK